MSTISEFLRISNRSVFVKHKSPLNLLLAAALTLPVHAQQSAEQAKTKYSTILKQVQDGNLEINFRDFRLAGTLMAGPHASSLEQAEQINFRHLMEAGKTAEALDAANQALNRNYASLSGHMDAILACVKLNKPAEADFHRKLLIALLDSIQNSGDGKTPETAWFVVTIPEEYIFLDLRLKLHRTQQALVRKDGHAYDKLTVLDPKTSQTQEVWFNTDVDLQQYKPPAARTPETEASLQSALQLYLKGQNLVALPLIQNLSAADPADAALQLVLADCLAFKADTNVTAAESVALLQQARDAALRARQLGNNSARLKELLARLNIPQIQPRKFSEVPEADKAMKDGEQALGTGDYDAALASYTSALKSDPNLYVAAVYAAEMCFRKNDMPSAAGWFGKAAALRPASPSVYIDWGNDLMLAGQPDQAKDKYMEAVVTLPAPQSWAALAGWAKRTNHQLAPPRIDRPPALNQPQLDQTNPDAQTNSDDGRSAWAAYSAVRAAWRQSLFSEKYPAEKQYRHTLEEETAALNSVVNALSAQKPPHLDPQLAALVELKNAGLLEAWILMNGADAGIIRDYVAYRETHRPQLKMYLEKCVVPNASK
jgi:hypothetical protein